MSASPLACIRGRAWVFGDRIDTDALAPGPYMRKPLQELARHCLEAIDPGFAGAVGRGDIVVGGHGFGIGSSREQAAQVLIELGVAAVIARGFARIFYRNALNLGLPALACEEFVIASGDTIALYPLEGRIVNETSGESWRAEPLPPRLLDVVEAGGLMPWLERHLRPAPASDR
jgi:3-isopropylmalate/(R)-2-methylmalate dehydratase small subunit